MAAMVETPNEEKAFQDWLREHPGGFVMNAWREPAGKPEHTMGVTWHRADCGFLGPNRTGPFVTGDTIKACAEDHGALMMWAVERGEPLYFCKECQAKSRAALG